MKKALVMGASGGIGFAIVSELAARGIQVVAFARGKEKLRALFENYPNVSIFPGDVFNEEHVRKASDGIDVMFHAISFPYQEWEETHMQCIQTIINVAQTQQAKIALVDNIYAYGRQSSIVTEEAIKEPHTKKGRYD